MCFCVYSSTSPFLIILSFLITVFSLCLLHSLIPIPGHSIWSIFFLFFCFVSLFLSALIILFLNPFYFWVFFSFIPSFIKYFWKNVTLAYKLSTWERIVIVTNFPPHPPAAFLSPERFVSSRTYYYVRIHWR